MTTSETMARQSAKSSGHTYTPKDGLLLEVENLFVEFHTPDGVAKAGNQAQDLLGAFLETLAADEQSYDADATSAARFELLEDCGHFSYLERPHDVRRAIEALVAQTGDR